jgi:hypothetical protein
MLLVLNLPLIGLWVKVLKIPYRVLFPLIILFTLIGSYSIGGNKYDILIMLIMGGLGYLMRKFHYEPAPFIFAFILGAMFEQRFRQSLLYSSGSLLVFIERPISASLVFAALVLMISPLVGFLRGKGKKSKLVVVGKKEDFIHKRYDLWSSAVLLAFALAYGWEAKNLGISNLRNPGPGFFPVVLGSILGLLALFLMCTTIFQRKTEEPFPGIWYGLRWHKTILVLVSLTIYVFLLEPLGYLFSTLLLMIYLFKGIEPQKWWVALVGAILSSTVTYVLFKVFLQVQLPQGIFSLG